MDTLAIFGWSHKTEYRMPSALGYKKSGLALQTLYENNACCDVGKTY